MDRPPALLYSGAFSEDTFFPNPLVDSASVVPDLKALSLNRFHQMQVLLAVHLAEHDVANLEGGGDHRLDSV